VSVAKAAKFGDEHSYSEIDEMAKSAGQTVMLVNPDDPIFFNPE